jgi:hypothetical protein
MPFLSAEIMQGTFASMPAFGSAGRIYFATDTGQTFNDSGSAWVNVSDAGVVTTVAGRTGAVVLAESDIASLTSDLALKAPLASPTFTGTVIGPTPSTADNSTKLATTAYVQAQGFGAGSGTVTSVALTSPSWLSVAGSPITASGTLAVTATSGLTANQFLATPNGSTGAVGLRNIAEADLDVPSFTTLTDSSAVTWNTNNLRISNAVLTMAHGTSTRSLTLTNLTAGASGTIIVKQDSTGGAALTFGGSPASKVIGGGGGAVTVTPAANAVDVLCWMYDGVGLYWTIGQNFS